LSIEIQIWLNTGNP